MSNILAGLNNSTETTPTNLQATGQLATIVEAKLSNLNVRLELIKVKAATGCFKHESGADVGGLLRAIDVDDFAPKFSPRIEASPSTSKQPKPPAPKQGAKNTPPDACPARTQAAAALREKQAAQARIKEQEAALRLPERRPNRQRETRQSRPRRGRSSTPKASAESSKA